MVPEVPKVPEVLEVPQVPKLVDILWASRPCTELMHVIAITGDRVEYFDASSVEEYDDGSVFKIDSTSGVSADRMIIIPDDGV